MGLGRGRRRAGTLIGSDVGTTRDGDQVPIKLIRTRDGAVRSLWLFESPQMLREKFAEHDPQEGDFLMVRRYAKRKTEDGERTYWPFAIAVIPASPDDAETPSGDDSGAATPAAFEDERDARDAALSELHAPLDDAA